MNSPIYSKLILFDIDGTLINHIKRTPPPGYSRWEYALSTAFNKKITIDLQTNYNGWVDRQIGMDLVKKHGISKKDFDTNFNKIKYYLLKHAQKEENTVGVLYLSVSGVKEFLDRIKTKTEYVIGLLTGNVESIAWWKLKHCGLKEYFEFGLFGDEIDDRIKLAGTVFAKAKEFLHQDFASAQIYVIGDTAFDVKCGKAIGAHTVAVTTGGHSRREIEAEKPDLIADSLSDDKVWKFLNL